MQTLKVYNKTVKSIKTSTIYKIKLRSNYSIRFKSTRVKSSSEMGDSILSGFLQAIIGAG
jgi:hypothetical protein